MGSDKVRHLVTRRGLFFWQPSKTIAALGMSAEPLGPDAGAARTRAIALNNRADELRRSSRTGSNGPRPGTFSRLVVDFKASEEFAELKPRTQRDYAYYLDKIEQDFAAVMARAITPKVVKTFYKRVKREVSETWAYHILGAFRVVLSWAVSEDWIKSNPALEVTMKSPKKRTVIWTPDQAETYVAKAAELGWHSIVAMVRVYDSIGQSPVDVRTLLRKSYDGRTIAVMRAKTGVSDAPIPLFPIAIAALDAYLQERPALPEAPLFANDQIGGMWNESTLGKVHRKIRVAAKLPKELQLQDFRTTVQTEGGAAGGTVDELRGLARHSTRDAGEHYVHPDARYIEAIQDKRLAHRNKTRQKVGAP